MVSPALIAGGVNLLGGLLGGKAKKKAANNAAKLAAQLASDIDQAYARDQQSVKVLRAEDEARLASATGFDFTKLRDDAIKAGFNPLTVLQATGGAGYDGRGAVLATPFFSQGDAKVSGASLMMGIQPAVIDSAGYVGNAIQQAGSAYFGQKNFDTAAAVDQERLRLDQIAMLGRRGGSGGGGGSGGAGSGVANTPFGATVATSAKGTGETFWDKLFGFKASDVAKLEFPKYDAQSGSQSYKYGDRIFTVPVGPDLESVAGGVAGHGAAWTLDSSDNGARTLRGAASLLSNVFSRFSMINTAPAWDWWSSPPRASVRPSPSNPLRRLPPGPRKGGY